MTTATSGPTPSGVIDRKGLPTDLREAIQDLMRMKDHETALSHLVEKLLSFSSGAVDVVEIDQTRLRLVQADGTRHHFRVHPQGMEVDLKTGLIYITAVEMIEQKDAARQYCGKGRAHLFECDTAGNTIRSINLMSDDEEEYHPSGMVLVNGTMFIALARYLPNTSATIIKFNIKDWTYEKLFRIQDHVGLVVPNLAEEELFLGTWGSRHYYRTDLKGNIKSKHQNPCFDELEHQDAQLISLGAPGNVKLDSKTSSQAEPEVAMMLATGVTAGEMEYFGLDIINVADWSIKTSLRWPSAQHLTKGGWAPFANPTYLWVDSYQRVLALAAPDDSHEQTGRDATLVLYTLTPRD